MKLPLEDQNQIEFLTVTAELARKRKKAIDALPWFVRLTIYLGIMKVWVERECTYGRFIYYKYTKFRKWNPLFIIVLLLIVGVMVAAGLKDAIRSMRKEIFIVHKNSI